MFESTKDVIARIRKENDERFARHFPREDASTSEGVKALLAINGGGVVAMLGFMQALINKSGTLAAFKYYGSNAMLFFAVGLVCAAFIPALRVLDVNNTLYGKDPHYGWEYGLYVAWGASLICFIVGISFVGFGIQIAVK